VLILGFLLEKMEKLRSTEELNLHHQVMCAMGAILPPSLSLGLWPNKAGTPQR